MDNNPLHTFPYCILKPKIKDAIALNMSAKLETAEYIEVKQCLIDANVDVQFNTITLKANIMNDYKAARLERILQDRGLKKRKEVMA